MAQDMVVWGPQSQHVSGRQSARGPVQPKSVVGCPANVKQTLKLVLRVLAFFKQPFVLIFWTARGHELRRPLPTDEPPQRRHLSRQLQAIRWPCTVYDLPEPLPPPCLSFMLVFLGPSLSYAAACLFIQFVHPQ